MALVACESLAMSAPVIAARGIELGSCPGLSALLPTFMRP
jgi:hypothetical protein